MGLFVVIAYLIVEVIVSLEVADALGTLGTLAALLAGIVLGVVIIRVQGPLRMMQAAAAMREGKTAQAPLAAGFFSAIAGALFIAPGFLSDALALLLLLPWVQQAAVARFKSKMQAATVATHAHFYSQFSSESRGAAGNVYDGEVIPDADAQRLASPRDEQHPPADKRP